MKYRFIDTQTEDMNIESHESWGANKRGSSNLCAMKTDVGTVGREEGGPPNTERETRRVGGGVPGK